MMTKHARILVVEDEADLHKVLQFNLENEGYEVAVAETGEDALKLVLTFSPHLILLDLMLPDIQGFEICRTLKSNPKTQNIPIVFLTARGEEIDRIVGFEVGAEDYVVKPFSVRELLLRIKTILKRYSLAPIVNISRSEIVNFGTIALDSHRHRVHLKGKEIELTATEFRLLETFLQTQGEANTREDLLKKAWGNEINLTLRTVDTHVKRLREKLGDAGKYIETIRGVGYRFSEEP